MSSAVYCIIVLSGECTKLLMSSAVYCIIVLSGEWTKL